jgi:TRAP-type C4-dicarboxylate transport system substrate-binding protein
MSWGRNIAVIAAVALCAAMPNRSEAEPISLKFAIPTPAVSSINTRILVPWSGDVAKASGDMLEIKVFPGGAIANFANVWDRTINAVTDIAWGSHGYYPSQFPKSFVAMLPFESRSSAEAAGALWALYEKGLIADEYQSVKLLGFGDFPNVSLHSRKPITSMADMRGVKIVALSRTVGQAVEKLGATPIVLQFSEVFQALQRGTVDAVAGGWPTVPALNLTEVTTHHLVMSLGTEAMFLIMNRDSYARLPAAVRGQLDNFSYAPFVKRATTVLDAYDADAREAVATRQGQTVTDLSPAEEARWRETVASLIREWANVTPNGSNILSAFRNEVARIRSGM